MEEGTEETIYSVVEANRSPYHNRTIISKTVLVSTSHNEHLINFNN